MSAYQRYFSPEQVESDHKDIIISQLKAELFEMKRAQKEYDATFSELRDTENEYYDLLRDVDLLRADCAKEEDDQIHEINLLRGDLDALEHRNADKKAQVDKLNSHLHSLRTQLHSLDDEIRDLAQKLRSLQTEGDRYDAEVHRLEDKLRGMDNDHSKLLNECAKSEDQIAIEEKRFRQMDTKLNDLLRTRDTVQGTLENGEADLAGLRKAITDLRNDCIDKENRAADLKAEIQRLDEEYADIESENGRLQDELSKLKQALADQSDRNADLYDAISGLEKDLSHLNGELNRLRSDLSYIEEKFARANGLNSDYVSILEELKRAIEELTHQNKLIIQELEMISEQDEHVRNILDRKGKIDNLKAITAEKIKKYSHTRGLTLSSASAKPRATTQPAPPVKQVTKYERTVQRTTFKNY